MPVKHVPDGYHSVTPYLVVKGVADLLPFLEKAFGASLSECLRRPDGTVMHAEARIGDSVVMLGEASEKHPPRPSVLYLYVPDCDAAWRRALAAGATSILEPTDQFYGDRSGGVADPCGNQWWIGSRVEDLSPEEIARRAAKAGK